MQFRNCIAVVYSKRTALVLPFTGTFMAPQNSLFLTHLLTHSYTNGAAAMHFYTTDPSVIDLIWSLHLQFGIHHPAHNEGITAYWENNN